MDLKDTIVALATAPGMAAIAVVRISGPKALEIAGSYFVPRNRKISVSDFRSHTVHLGEIRQGDRVYDEVLLTYFRGPRSYTGENVVEISCHGSTYVQEQLLQLFIRGGCRMAEPGEFTLRAFLNGKMDLDQAEAVADLIASDSQASADQALKHLRGGFNSQIAELRDQLLKFASLIELELDFSGEDVSFADRTELRNLLERLKAHIKSLLDSYALGNVIKSGIPVALVGEPNVGKSTLLNALLNEERAIVSDIPGTTRDTVEDEMVLSGIRFRFIDTAGLRITDDAIEQIGIQRSLQALKNASLVMHLQNAADLVDKEYDHQKLDEFLKFEEKLKTKDDADPDSEAPEMEVMVVVNKWDQLNKDQRGELKSKYPDFIFISALKKEGLDALKDQLLDRLRLGKIKSDDVLLTNSRHYQALQKSLNSVEAVEEGMDADIPSDLLAIDIRQALHHLGEITGSITTDDLLGQIFSSFCIGK